MGELNSPALHILLASISRGFLRYTGLHQIVLADMTNKIVSTSLASSTQPHVIAARAIASTFGGALVSPGQMNALMKDLDSLVKKAYESLPESERTAIETEMLTTASIPEVLVPVVRSFLQTSVENLRQEVNESELYFRDFSMLGLHEDNRTKRWWKEHTLDGVRKIELRREGQRGGVRLRTCARCGAVMEDIIPHIKPTRQWLLNLQRACFCAGHWMVT